MNGSNLKWTKQEYPRNMRHAGQQQLRSSLTATPESSAVTSIQRKPACACGGSCPRCASDLAIQTKLKIGAPNDKYEQEADRVAEQVMRMPDPSLKKYPAEEIPVAQQITPLVQREVAEEEDDEEALEEKQVQAKPIGSEFTTMIQSNIGEEECEETVHSQLYRHRIRPGNVSCRRRGIWHPRVRGPNAVNAIRSADSQAITLGRRAELLIFFNRIAFGDAAYAMDPTFNNALRNRFGLDINNTRDRETTLPILETRFKSVTDVLEGGWMRYTCRGSDCAFNDFAYVDPGVYRIHLCNQFWNTPADRGKTILHEAMHIYYSFIGDRQDCPSPSMSNAWCYELFAEDIAP